MTTAERLNTIPLGEAMFTQRAIRRFKPDPIPEEVMRDIMEATIRAPNGGNAQPWRFIVVQDAELRQKLGELYHEAWWAKRKDAGINGPEDIPPGRNTMRSAMRLANEIGNAPVMVLICATSKGAQAAGSGDSIVPEHAIGGASLRRGRHHCHAAPGGGREGPQAVRHPRHRSSGLLHALGLPAWGLRAGNPQAVG